ncbi:MAG: murein hydrolase activator EnvC family protein [Acetatifactor sp.]
MKRVRHKRKSRHMLLVTSDAVDAGVKQYRLHPGLLYGMLLLLCIAIGVLIGYFVYEQDAMMEKETESMKQQEAIALLEQEKAELETQVASLNETVQILSDTVNQKTQSENQLSEQLEKQTTPTEFPLTGSASMEEVTEGDPMCIFTAAAGAMVVSTASGTVVAVNDDSEYGHNIWIDHGNGYVTIYRNQGDVKVKQGEEVTQGTTLFLISDENSKLGYQMMKDGAYINPMDMLVISG